MSPCLLELLWRDRIACHVNSMYSLTMPTKTTAWWQDGRAESTLVHLESTGHAGALPCRWRTGATSHQKLFPQTLSKLKFLYCSAPFLGTYSLFGTNIFWSRIICEVHLIKVDNVTWWNTSKSHFKVVKISANNIWCDLGTLLTNTLAHSLTNNITPSVNIWIQPVFSWQIISEFRHRSASFGQVLFHH